jgi:hypothetical protein
MKAQKLQAIFWDRVGDRWLVGRGAAMLFAASAMANIAGSVVLIWRWAAELAEAPFLAPFLIVTVGLSGLFLMSAMNRYWARRDRGSRVARRIWYFVLTLVVFYGASLYYAAVYLPQVRRDWRPQ